MRRSAAIAGAVLALASALGWRFWRASVNERQPLPKLMLWAWERPEDLRFLNPEEAGVAYLAGTVILRGGGIEVRPRLQPLRLPPGIRLLAVVRMEADAEDPPQLGEEQRNRAASAIIHLTDRDGVMGTQTDFDAAVSQRGFYAALVKDLRERLPPGRLLSITALASWCLGDDWIAGLPADEAVPMLFRMGPDGGEARERLRRGADFPEPLCRKSFGVSTDEPRPRLRYGRRIYVFHPRAWTEAAAANILREARSWR